MSTITAMTQGVEGLAQSAWLMVIVVGCLGVIFWCLLAGHLERRNNPRSDYHREYRRQMRNPYAPSPETRAARDRLHAAAEEVDR